MLTALKWIAIVFGALIIVLVLVLAFVNWNGLRGPIANMASKRLDREVRIDGDLHAHLLSWTPRMEINGLKIGQPRWVKEGRPGAAENALPRDMVDVGRITVEFKWGSLLIGNAVLPRLEIEKPELYLLRKSEDQANWQFGKRPVKRDSKPLELPVVRNFILRGGRIQIVDEVRKLKFEGSVEAMERVAANNAYPFKLIGSGELNNQPFKLELRGGPMINIDRDKPYAIDGDVQAGTTRLSARGSITKPFDLGKLQFALDASGDDLANLYYLTGLALPNTPPYKVKTRLRREETKFYLDDFAGRIGDSDVGGDLSIETEEGRPVMRGELVSKSLDLDDLAAPLGGAPQAQDEDNSAETISPAQRAKAKAMSEQRRLFPDAELQVERVRGMDADVKFHAGAVRARKIPMREVAFHLKLDAGVLRLDPVSFVLPQGRFEGSVRLDARPETPVGEVDFRMKGLQLGQFKPRNGQPPLEGALLGRVQLKGRGNSIAKFVASGDGLVTAVVPAGEIREAFAELTGINVARGLGLLLSKDQQQVRVRCGVADFQLRDGKLTARTLVFDTENVLITGKGDINLASEKADLEIKGQPKKLRFLRVRAPITIKGPLRKPQIGVEGEDLAKQTGAAAVLSVLAAPIAAVIAFVDPGLAKDANCSALMSEVQAHSGEGH